MFRTFSISTALLPFITLSLAACTTSQVKKNAADTPEAVATAPTKALNINKREIPDELKDLGNPYDVKEGLSCQDIQDEITFLTEFAGPDWDSDEHYTKSGRSAAEFADAVLPYGGIVRFISGASEHEKKLAAAHGYSSVRRAVLKTRAKNKGCK